MKGHARRARRRGGASARRRDDVHAVRRPRVPDVRRRRQGRAPDAPARRPPRADRRLRGRGDRQAHPGARPRRPHRRTGRDQRRQRDRAGAVRRLAHGRGGRPGPAEPVGQRQPAGARPAADHRADQQARAHHPDRRRRGGRLRRGLHRWLLPRTAGRPSSTCPMDEFFNQGAGSLSAATPVDRTPDPDAHRPGRRPARRRRATRGHPRHRRVGRPAPRMAALRLVETLGLPAITNGMGRGVVPGGHPLLVTKARGQALDGADLVVVVGTPLDFRLGYGVFGGKDGGTGGARGPPGRLRRPGRHARRARRVGVRRPVVGPRRLLASVDRLGRRPAGRRGPTTCVRGSPPPSSATPPC